MPPLGRPCPGPGLLSTTRLSDQTLLLPAAPAAQAVVAACSTPLDTVKRYTSASKYVKVLQVRTTTVATAVPPTAVPPT